MNYVETNNRDADEKFTITRDTAMETPLPPDVLASMVYGTFGYSDNPMPPETQMYWAEFASCFVDENPFVELKRVMNYVENCVHGALTIPE